VPLEDEADPGTKAPQASSRQRADVLAEQPHVAAFELQQTQAAAEQRRLSGAVGPDQGECLARIELEGDVVQDGGAAVPFSEPLDREIG
jgi:hypothetical protein